jgi:hypothetical protein
MPAVLAEMVVNRAAGQLKLGDDPGLSGSRLVTSNK